MKSILTILFLVSSPALANECMRPFQSMTSSVTGRNFMAQDVYNDYANVKDMYRNRYIVVNLDSAENGQCKGVTEHYPGNGDMHTGYFPELANPQDAQYYQAKVLKYYHAPLTRSPVAGGGFCMGQTVTLCELRGNQAFEIAKLATSARDGKWGPPPYLEGSSSYYSELNVINTRRWSVTRDAYSADDAARDREMGGVQPGGRDYDLANGETRAFGQDDKPKWVMPNFINFIAAPGYYGNPANGLHELSRGETSHATTGTLGAPVSHGCLRLSKYGSILLRWWLPRGARMFVYLTPDGYLKIPPR